MTQTALPPIVLNVHAMLGHPTLNLQIKRCPSISLIVGESFMFQESDIPLSMSLCTLDYGGKTKTKIHRPLNPVNLYDPIA